MALRAIVSDQDLYFSIYASELRLVAGNSAHWGNTETGGALFGLMSHGRRPMVVLATPPCPNATHEHAHFADDPEEFQRRAALLAEWGGLQVVGTYHSHHELVLPGPSGGDTREVQSITTRNGYTVWIEVITTHEALGETPQRNRLWPFSRQHQGGGARGFDVRINSFFYPNPSDGRPARCPIKVVPGMSPYRQVLLNSSALPEEALGFEYLGLAMDRIRYDHLGESHRDRKGGDGLPGNVLEQIRSLPEAVRQGLQITATEELIVVAFPVDRGDRVQVAFDRNGRRGFRAVHLLAGDVAGPKDITQAIHSWKDSPSLGAIYQRILDSQDSCSPLRALTHARSEGGKDESADRVVVNAACRRVPKTDESEADHVER